MDEPALFPAPASPEALLTDHAWARRLAQRLVRDATLADDLAQEACVRALEHPPRHDLRAWLGGVVRNLARSERRARGRRVKREELVAVPEALPSAADALARLSVQQDVVRAVLALEEPYRSTIVLRFYEDLPPRKIAARTGVPVATVKTRLARGLAQLRAALDREHGGDGRSWALFLVPLAGSFRPTPWIPGGLAVSTALKLAVASTAVLVLGLWLVQRSTRGTAPTTSPEGAPALALQDATTPSAALAPADREPLSATGTSSSAPASEPMHAAVFGHVFDPSGAPVAGVALGLRESHGVVSNDGPNGGEVFWAGDAPHSAPLAVSAGDGSFTLQRPDLFTGRVVSQDARWETVLAPAALPGTEAPMVVAPLFQLRGRVTDPAGAPLAGADVAFFVARQRVQAPGIDFTDAHSNGWSTRSDADGRFALARLPAVAGALLRVRLAPFETAQIERAEWHDDELAVELAEPHGAWLTGHVVARGEPLAGATVALGLRGTHTDARGDFRLSLAELAREDELCVAAAGFLPTRVHGDRQENGVVRWPEEVRVMLAGEPLTLAGRVVDTDGRPLARQQVWLADALVVCADERNFPVLLESILAGGAEMVHGSETDAEGRFRIGGLDERDYRLEVVDPGSALVLDGGSWPAGTDDVLVRRASEMLREHLRGVVVDRTGAPIADAFLYVDRELEPVTLASTSMQYGRLAHGPSAKTRADGSFELGPVARDGAVLHAGGAGMVDPEVELTAALDPENVRVVVARAVRVQVTVGDAQRSANGLAVLDAAGKRRLSLSTASGAGDAIAPFVALADGRSPVFEVSDEGALVVLYEGSRELGRFPVTLRAGELNRIDL